MSANLSAQNSMPSIQRRLLRQLLWGLPALFIMTATWSIVSIIHEVNEISDDQLKNMANHIALLHMQQNASLPVSSVATTDDSKHEPDNDEHINDQRFADFLDAESYIQFAVWDAQGHPIIGAQSKDALPFRQGYTGFNVPASENIWRSLQALWHDWHIYYLTVPEANLSVAVGQDMGERREIVQGVITAQVVPFLLGMGLLVAWVWWAVHRSLQPLSQLGQAVANRRVDDLEPLSVVTSAELMPLVTELNRLFGRVQETLEQERRFTADASHELRSPLAGLKMHSDVLALLIKALPQTNDASFETTYQKLQHHNAQLHAGVARASHLLDQLLLLARLDPTTSLSESGYDSQSHPVTTIDWQAVSDEAMDYILPLAKKKRLYLKRQIAEDALPLQGNQALMVVLVRNLLDNAVRYTPPQGTIEFEVNRTHLMVTDSGGGVPEAVLPRLAQRFYRHHTSSLNADQQGSGLGLSIVAQIARLHGLQVELQNQYAKAANNEPIVTGLKVKIGKIKIDQA